MDSSKEQNRRIWNNHQSQTIALHYALHGRFIWWQNVWYNVSLGLPL